jgi:hypothetical protein
MNGIELYQVQVSNIRSTVACTPLYKGVNVSISEDNAHNLNEQLIKCRTAHLVRNNEKYLYLPGQEIPRLL